MKLHKITLLLILLFNQVYSQELNDNVEKLKIYKTVSVKSYGNWTSVFELENGFIVNQKNLSKKITTLIKKNIYDRNNNIIYEISSYDINNGNKIDTISSYKYEYDELNRMILKKAQFGMIEKFSDFSEFSKPKLIERLNENEEAFDLEPFKEILEYDSIGNLVKETKFDNIYPEENNTIKKISIETNRFKYDDYGNITEIKREFTPKIKFPIEVLGGFPLYEHEKFEYKYNKNGLWVKKYLLVEGKKYLIKKREFSQ